MAGLALAESVAAAVLVPRGATWRFLDDGSTPTAQWRDLDFDDGNWRAGAAQLGYGDGDETTIVSFGTNSASKQITTYFRHRFSAANLSAYRDVTLSLLRDDGAVVYLNGREVFRSNLPAGTIGAGTLASSAVGGSEESSFVTVTFGPTNLAEGVNILAVEVHQAAANSSDLSFDLELAGNHPPIRMTLLSPKGTDAVTGAASLCVGLEEVCTTNVVTVYGRRAGATAGADFTIVALPDTQYYVAGMNGGRPEMFQAQTDWIVANRASRNIVFVTQLGDCVENGDNNGNPIEWHHATNAMYRLEDPLTTSLVEGIPYGIAVGNHDQSPGGSAGGATRFYNEYFGEAHFAGREYYGGHYGTNNDDHFELFSASGLDFMVIHLEFDPAQDTNVLRWANGLLAEHRDRRAIIVSHYIMGTSGNFGPQGQKIFDGLKHNPNLFLMLCGHDPGEGRRTDVVNGNLIHTVLSDYQGRTNGGSGFLRLLEFSPSNNVIRVRTYSPVFDAFETDNNSEFTLAYDMRGGEAFDVIARADSVCAATNLTAVWPGLAANTRYEWFVEANDGSVIQRSPVWQFTTGPAPTFEPPRLTLSRLPSGDLLLSWTTNPGVVYQVVTRDHLTNANWSAASDELIASGTSLSWTATIAPMDPHRFFAVKVVR